MAAEPLVVGDVARRLLEVGHQPPPLEQLRQDVRGLLARQVHAAELGDRVVAVLDEDLLVQCLGPLEADGGVDGGVAADVELAHEFVEEQAAQALVGAGVAGEQRPLHDLGEVDEAEHGLVEIRDVAPQDRGLVRVELLDRVGVHRP